MLQSVNLHWSEEFLFATVLHIPQSDSRGTKQDYLLPVKRINGDSSCTISNTHTADFYAVRLRNIPTLNKMFLVFCAYFFCLRRTSHGNIFLAQVVDIVLCFMHEINVTM